MQSDRNWEINWVSIPFRQMVAAWLNWDGFFPLVLLEEKGVDVILQFGVESVVIGTRVIYIVFNASVYIGVAYGVTDIMADKTAHVGQAFFTLLPGADSGKLHETATEKSN